MASSKWSTEMDRRVAEMRRDPVKYVEAARREARRTSSLSGSAPSRVAPTSQKRGSQR